MVSQHTSHDPADGIADDTADAIAVPVVSMVESIVGCKWSVSLLDSLADGPNRPSALLRAHPGLSAKVMSERLRKMTRFGMLQRTVIGAKPPLEVEYALTGFGCRFLGILDEVRRLQNAVDAGELRAGVVGRGL